MNERGMRRGLGALLMLTSCFAGACGTTAEATRDESEIIGGVSSKSSRLDAVGSLRRIQDDGSFRSYCTATLIAPRLIITAKHCSARDGQAPYTENQTIEFAIGHDSTAPRRVVKAERTWMASLAEGGFIKRGSDVAVMTLAEPIDDVEPLHIADDHLDASVVGSRLSAVGYGIRAMDRTSKQRRAGTLTVRGTEGSLFGGAFGSLEELLAYAKAEGGEAFDDADAERLTKLWDQPLLPQYETFAGLAPGDAQPCSGDSGGPLIARVEGGLAVFAVVSGSFKLGGLNPCSVLGEVYATFPADIQAMIDEAAATVETTPKRVAARDVLTGSEAPAPAALSDLVDVDRCGEESVAGRCDRGAALRCIAATEGPKRVTRTDCTLLMQTCTETPDGAECTDEGG